MGCRVCKVNQSGPHVVVTPLLLRIGCSMLGALLISDCGVQCWYSSTVSSSPLVCMEPCTGGNITSSTTVEQRSLVLTDCLFNDMLSTTLQTCWKCTNSGMFASVQQSEEGVAQVDVGLESSSSPTEGQQLARHLHVTVSQGIGGPRSSSSLSCTCTCITNHVSSLTDTSASASAILLQQVD